MIALTRKPGRTLSSAELTFQPRREIDLSRALEQHTAYESCLEELGARVISLPADPDYPDSVFVEDPAIVLEEAAILTRPGAESRRGETAAIGEALAPYRELRFVHEPATLEGGDVLRAGRTLYVGVSQRTNLDGVSALSRLTQAFGYRVTPVIVKNCLHLKTACAALPDGRILVHRAWIDSAPIAAVLLDAPEPQGANVLDIAGTVLAPHSAPRTAELLHREGYRVRTLDISEFEKAEGGLTCLSLLFSGR
jgi:dimethylargininase